MSHCRRPEDGELIGDLQHAGAETVDRGTPRTSRPRERLTRSLPKERLQLPLPNLENGGENGVHRSYCFAYGLPSAAGATVRPITPATAISVSTYGRIWNSVPADWE